MLLKLNFRLKHSFIHVFNQQLVKRLAKINKKIIKKIKNLKNIAPA
jgi:hypothetical protein